MSEAKATAKGQYPAAIVFSCVDSRAPAELILDFGIGDIFSGRVAGNIADEDILGQYGVCMQGRQARKVVLVMGPHRMRCHHGVPSTECSLAIFYRVAGKDPSGG